jgi:hypothetical protein
MSGEYAKWDKEYESCIKYLDKDLVIHEIRANRYEPYETLCGIDVPHQGGYRTVSTVECDECIRRSDGY